MSLTMRTSLEIVPRTGAELDAAVTLIANRYPGIDTVNVPDRPSCALTSLDAVNHIRGRIPQRIPHLRACDFSEPAAIELIHRLAALAIDEVIVIAGDRAADADRKVGFEPSTLIRFIANHAPGARVYAALDPHRYDDDGALAGNIEQKLAAGAAGFFTQPLFDLNDLDRCRPLLHGTTTFWGLSPVVSPRSQRYWQHVNGVRFPAGFAPTLKWNHAFALRLLSEIAAHGDNAYLMPIKVDIDSYLAPLEARFVSL
jgi:methylenetetrahydrofolate reductase (NADPH)